MSWASNHDASIEKLQRVQGSLTVDLIMIERDDFFTCKADETAREVAAKNTNQFSFLPVIDQHDQIIGLYNAERWFTNEAPQTKVGNDIQQLSEQIIIGADASIFDFIRQADAHPTNLVISRERIAGLVSMSDIQQLPVRAALFSLITSLEMAMAATIQRHWPQTDGWLALLKEHRQQKLNEEISIAKERDVFVDAIAFTQFCDKTDLIREAQILPTPECGSKGKLKNIQKLRDNLAHANSYADTPKEARKVCEVVRSIYKLKEELLGFISTSQ